MWAPDNEMRRKNDFYPTPEWATRELVSRVTVSGLISEPCAGDFAIVRVLADQPKCFVISSDIDRGREGCSTYGDATDIRFWCALGRTDWVITNPPFNQAAQIVPLAYEHATFGIAMLLRLSYLEPVEDRGAWLSEHPPTKLIVLPRISFTNDGKTDSVTCAWMVWEKSTFAATRIIVAENPRFTQATTTALRGADPNRDTDALASASN